MAKLIICNTKSLNKAASLLTKASGILSALAGDVTEKVRKPRKPRAPKVEVEAPVAKVTKPRAPKAPKVAAAPTKSLLGEN